MNELALLIPVVGIVAACVALCLCELVGERILARLRPTLLREPGERAALVLLPPLGEVRRVETLAAEQLADGALRTRRNGGVRLPDDTQLVLSRE